MKKRINSKFNSSSDCSISKNIELVWFRFSVSSLSEQWARKFRIRICMMKLKSISFVVSASITRDMLKFSLYATRRSTSSERTRSYSLHTLLSDPDDDNVREFSLLEFREWMEVHDRRALCIIAFECTFNSSQYTRKNFCLLPQSSLSLMIWFHGPNTRLLNPFECKRCNSLRSVVNEWVMQVSGVKTRNVLNDVVDFQQQTLKKELWILNGFFEIKISKS